MDFNRVLVPHKATKMSEKYRICWEAFKSPFKKKKKKSDDYETPWDKIEKGEEEQESGGGNMLVAMTPMGPIPLDTDALNKTFNFWIGHTNFNITAEVVNLIRQTPGVESLDIFTRYRMRIGIGKLFEQHEVMSAIGTHVLKHLEKK